jgi:hypothetical protein
MHAEHGNKKRVIDVRFLAARTEVVTGGSMFGGGGAGNPVGWIDEKPINVVYPGSKQLREKEIEEITTACCGGFLIRRSKKTESNRRIRDVAWT